MCATPAPIDRPSSMLPPTDFLLQPCLYAPFSPSSFYLRTSIFFLLFSSRFSMPPPSATLHSPCLSPVLSFPPSPFLSCFPQVRGCSSCPPADQGRGTGIEERHGPWAAGPGAAELLQPPAVMERAVSVIVVLAWQRWEEGGRGWGGGAGNGKGFETSTAPLCFHLLQFIWCPVEFMILPPAKSCCVSSHRVPSSRVIDQLVCSSTTSKGIMSKAKLSPSNSFRNTDYLSFASGKTVSIHSKSPWWS